MGHRYPDSSAALMWVIEAVKDRVLKQRCSTGLVTTYQEPLVGLHPAPGLCPSDSAIVCETSLQTSILGLDTMIVSAILTDPDL